MEKANENEERKREKAEEFKIPKGNIVETKEKAKKEKKPTDKEKLEELTDTLKRLQAEFENYKKRADKEKEEFAKYANAAMIAKLLPLLDTFEIALRNTKDHEKFLKGMEMVYAQLFSALEAEGLRPITAEGKKFDPYYHEVMLKQESDKEEGIVLEELQRGYMFKDKVLRYSKVKISGKKVEKNQTDEKNIAK
ncbi:nucleotide exchange factor GrpE [Candidatus Woesearchaeota archaeon]|nr:nucleotide exchange factor GrpE [Candidatus Woesearchaeota archaeon]